MVTREKRMGEVIVLTKGEVLQVAYAGVLRTIQMLFKDPGNPGRHASTKAWVGDHTWATDIESCGGELAVAKYTDRYWTNAVIIAPRIGTPADVGEWQVRTKLKSTDRLIVRPTDDDDQIFISVLGAIPRFEIMGWILGEQAKQPEWLEDYRERGPAWFVPDSALNDPRTLLEIPAPTRRQGRLAL